MKALGPELLLFWSSAGVFRPELSQTSVGVPGAFSELRKNFLSFEGSGSGAFTFSELCWSFSDSGRSSAKPPSESPGAFSELRKNFRNFEGSGSGVFTFSELRRAGAPPAPPAESRSSSDGALEKNSGGVFLPEFWEFYSFFPEFYSFSGAPAELFPELRRSCN